eukprot:UN18580
MMLRMSAHHGILFRQSATRIPTCLQYSRCHKRRSDLLSPDIKIGGKSFHFPKNYEQMIYVESFVGVGSVSWAKEKSRKIKS